MSTSTVQFTNFASSTVIGTYGTGDTSFTIATSNVFPTAVLGVSWFYAVLTDSVSAPTKREIIKVTNTSGAIFTVVRAQDNTTAQTWATGSVIELRVVNKALQDLFDEAVSDATTGMTSLTSTGNITITVDSDNNGSGAFNVLSGSDTVLQVINAGELIANPGYCNIKYFGGDATGSNDNAPAVAAAIAAGHTAIYFPRGEYKFLSGISTTNQNLTLFGDGHQTSILFTEGAAGFDLISFTGQYLETRTDALVVRDLNLQTRCNSSVAQGSAIYAVVNYPTASSDTQPNTSVVIDNVAITVGHDNACWEKGIELDTCQMSKISNVFITGWMPSTGYACLAAMDLYSRYTTNNNAKATDINITNCVIWQSQVGIRVNKHPTSTHMNCEGVHINGCTLLGVLIGVQIGDDTLISADALPGWFITGNHISATQRGIDIQTVSQFLISDNLIYGIGEAGTTTFHGTYIISPQNTGYEANGAIYDNTYILTGAYSGNTYGLYFEGSDAAPGNSSVRVTNNAFQSFDYVIATDANTTGVRVDPSNRVILGGVNSIAGSDNIIDGYDKAVGIGRTPQSRLDVYTATTDNIITSESGSGYAAYSVKGSGTNSTYFLFYNGTGERCRITVNNSAEMAFGTGSGGTEMAKLTSAGMIFPNAKPIYFNNSSGVSSPVLQKYSDDNVYLDNYSGAISLRSGTAEALDKSLNLASDGRLYGTGLHNSAGAVTGTTNQYIASGTFLPTLTGVTNVAATQNYTGQWIRVGNVVTFSGKFDLDVTAAGATELGIQLPIASNFANASNLGGGCHRHVSSASEQGSIAADVANDRAQVYINAVATGNEPWSFSFTYVVL